MKITLMNVEVQLEGCDSLKEKRGRMARWKARIGRMPNVAVCESGLQDVHARARYTVVVIAGDAAFSQRVLGNIEEALLTDVDGRVMDVWREEL